MSIYPIAQDVVMAGFPSPAEQMSEGRLDLNDFIPSHPHASFYVRVSGDSMLGDGILNGDILLVDRSLTAHSGDIIIAQYDGGFTVKRLVQRAGYIALHASNPAFAPIILGAEEELEVFGVVRAVIRKYRG